MPKQDDEIVEAVARAIDPRAWAAYDQAHREPWGDSERMLAKKNTAPSIVEARAAIAAHVAAMEAAGFVIVPREPTEEMKKAGNETGYECVIFSLEPGEGIDAFDMAPAYCAMIAARPDQR